MTKCSRRAALVGAIAITLVGTPVSAQSAAFVLTIARKYRGENCISGYLAVNSKIVAYTLERPWLGNKPMLSAIPDGSYAAILRYDHSDQWRIELADVPGRGNIQVHTGNAPDDSEGCILIGLKLGDDLCSLVDSKAAYAQLKAAFYGSENPLSTPDKRITVVVSS